MGHLREKLVLSYRSDIKFSEVYEWCQWFPLVFFKAIYISSFGLSQHARPHPSASSPIPIDDDDGVTFYFSTMANMRHGFCAPSRGATKS